MARATAPSGSSDIRCAVYTRKSSEEGLEQAFNSLHAQRDACLAYIQSQRHEGWRALPAHYDDGGFSGGTLERPALRRLLDDIRQRKVDLIVIYKVDRLTRSLADFAKLVDLFNTHSVSFVSITQQFNTSTSMGRLTLNMLLSFAQFEREVTGERIRDKIAASKRKGMWMGGNPPLGYDVVDRKLVINSVEAGDVRRIFELYLELGSVRTLMVALAQLAIVSKRRVFVSGQIVGGQPLSRGNLYQMLQNPLYRGLIGHKGQLYPGEHAPVIDVELWDKVQALLAEQRVARDGATEAGPSLLAGIIFDDTGRRLTPTHAKKGPRRYRYYVTQTLTTHTKADVDAGVRLPAGELESLVVGAVRELLLDPARLVAARQAEDATRQAALIAAAQRVACTFDSVPAAKRTYFIRRAVMQVVVGRGEVEVRVYLAHLEQLLLGADNRSDAEEAAAAGETMSIFIPHALRRVGREMRMVVRASTGGSEPDPSLVRLIGQALQFKDIFLAARDQDISQMAATAGVSGSHFTRTLRLAFLAPDIIQAIAAGRQPRSLTATRLARDLLPPIRWADQRDMLGFSRT